VVRPQGRHALAGPAVAMARLQAVPVQHAGDDCSCWMNAGWPENMGRVVREPSGLGAWRLRCRPGSQHDLVTEGAEAADETLGGTVFVDAVEVVAPEVGEIDPALQHVEDGVNAERNFLGSAGRKFPSWQGSYAAG
jgi:hypothetical protein